MAYIEKNILKSIYKERSKQSRKYDFGYVIVIGGSQLYSGSPALASLAAMRAGADLSLVVAPERSANIIASFSPNLISFPLAGHDINISHIDKLLFLAKSAKKVSNGKVAVVVGGGLGRDEGTQEVVRKFLEEIDIPAVIDADAILAISKSKNIAMDKNFVFTPHCNEYFVLTGENISLSSKKEKEKKVKAFANKIGSTLLLKGDEDIISDGKKIFINKTGCPEMTVGGTGDVVAGICGCFLAQGFSPSLSARAAAYISGRAGELALKNFGAGLLATDMIDCIPNATKGL